MALLELEQQETSDLLTVGENGLSDFTEIEAPAPGIYTDMPAQHYHKIRAASASRLKMLRRSPAHMREEILHPKPQTDAMAIGSAVHCRVLEPDRFEREYAIMPRFDKRTKLGKEAAANFEVENIGKQICDRETAGMAEAIYDKLMAGEISRSMLEAEGQIETSIFWIDPLTGVNCKARLDKYFMFEEKLTILDLKTAANASPEEFARQAFNLGYHIQAGFYLDGMSQTIEENISNFIFLPVEKEEPFEFFHKPLGEDEVDLGKREYKRLLGLWKECEASNIWTGYDKSLTPLTFPSWAFTK